MAIAHPDLRLRRIGWQQAFVEPYRAFDLARLAEHRGEQRAARRVIGVERELCLEVGLRGDRVRRAVVGEGPREAQSRERRIELQAASEQTDRLRIALPPERRFGERTQRETMVGMLAQERLQQELGLRHPLGAERIGRPLQRRLGGEGPQVAALRGTGPIEFAHGGEVPVQRRPAGCETGI